MGLFSRLRDATQGKGRACQETQNKLYLDALCSAYENVFAQVRPLVNEMKTVIPYGVTAAGKPMPVRRTPELAALLDPNDDMGWAEFADTMFVTWLTEDELDVHVWRDKRGRVYGYSVLPAGARKTLSGETYFEFTNAAGEMQRLSPEDVATLRYSRNPRNIDKGVSPASAIFVWTQIDDLIAQYQKAYFENGAVPAYITTIRASTREKYEAKRKEMEGGLKGAKNRNKTIYIWRQFLDDGSESDEVEVRTIQGNNSTLALKEILDAVNTKINKAFGVSNFIMGDDASAKYDNAELSDRNFAKRQVYPALMSFWDQFKHEMDRICGGLGYGISFDYEIPELTDREKTRAEIFEKNTGTLKSMIESGATPSAAVAALELDEKWLEVASGIYDRVLAGITSTNNDMLAKARVQTKTKIHPIKLNETHTIAASTTKDAIGYTAVFGEDEADAKKVYDALVKLLSDSINEALEEGEEVSEEAISEMVDEILKIGVEQADKGARLGAGNIRGLVAGQDAGDEIFKTLENDGFHVSEEFKAKWRDRTERIVNHYHADVRDKLRAALDTARENGVSREQLRQELEQAVPPLRAEMIARTETAEAFREGRLETDDYIARRYDLKIGKVWRTHMDERTCEVCEAMDGQVVELHEAFPDHVETADGVVMAFDHSEWNRDGESPNAHPLCRCDFEEVLL